MTRLHLTRFKCIVYAAWRINLFRPDATSPIPRHIWRRMGAA